MGTDCTLEEQEQEENSPTQNKRKLKEKENLIAITNSCNKKLTRGKKWKREDKNGKKNNDMVASEEDVKNRHSCVGKVTNSEVCKKLEFTHTGK